MISFAQQANTGKSNEWYTPAKYIEAARLVMGAIDLDPASCALANETVKATRYYSKEDDGLSKPWYGRVWLNPPYSVENGKANQEIWSQRLVSEYEQGHVRQAILMVQAKPGYLWFHDLWDYPICLTKGRVRFDTPSGPQHGLAILGSAFIYLGPHERLFIETFSQFGRIARAIDTPKPVSKPCELWEAGL